MKNYNSNLGRNMVLLAAFLTLAAAPAAKAADDNRRVLPPNSHPYGKTYGQWLAAHWQWLYSLQTASHPLFMDGNVDLSLHQPPGPVWFLGGKFCANGVNCSYTGVVRNCTVQLRNENR